MMLSLLFVKMDASIFGAWTGEKLDVTEGNYKDYYIYAMTTDVNNRGFLSFELVDGTYKPYLKAASLDKNDPNKTTVRATPTGERQNKQYVLTAFNCYQFINRQIPGTDDEQRMLNCNTNKYEETVIRSDYGADDALSIIGFGNAHTSHFAVFETGSGDGTFFIMFQRLETNNRLYLYGAGIDTECQYWEKDGSSENQNNSWLFISEEQYTLRQELGAKYDALKAKVEAGVSSPAENALYDEMKKSLDSGNISVQDLQEIKVDVDVTEAGLDLSSKKAQLEKEIIRTQQISDGVKEQIGVEPTSLSTAISEAKAVLEKEGATDAEYNQAKIKLEEVRTGFTLDYHYYVTVLEQAEALGYTHDPSKTNIASVTTQQGIIDATETLRGLVITYVKGRRYPSNTDFSIFIVNNSFEAGAVSAVSSSKYTQTIKGWSVGTVEGKNTYVAPDTKTMKNDATSGVDGLYMFSTGGTAHVGLNDRTIGCSLFQTINNLPKGKYKMSCLGASSIKNDEKESDHKLYLNVVIGSNTVKGESKCTNEYSFNTIETSQFEITSDNSSVQIKLEGNGYSNTSVAKWTIWFKADNFRLIYLGDNSTTIDAGAKNSLMSETNTEVAFEEGSYAEIKTRSLTVSGTTTETRKWNTMCLPYDCPIPSGVEVKKLSGINVTAGEGNADDMIKLQFETVKESMETGVPYLVKVTSDEQKVLTSQNVNVVNVIKPTIVHSGTVDERTYGYTAAMIGSYVQMYLVAGSYYISSGTDQLKKVGPTAKVNLKGYRAFFAIEKDITAAISEPVGNSANIRFSATTDDGEEITTIDGIELDKVIPSGEIYDLTGRKVEMPVKGIYIVNGRKYINK